MNPLAATITHLLRISVLATVAGGLAGAASALFLWLLGLATDVRVDHDWLVFGLPVFGLALGAGISRYGAPIRGGASLIIDTIHDGGPTVPVRMAPMVLAGTVLTHLFGGSAGREGTAVQMGASLTDRVSRALRLGPAMRSQLLVAGVAGGFGSVFGTPVAGAVFGLEFVALGRFDVGALLPAVIASVVGDMTTRALGIAHTVYPVAPYWELTAARLGTWVLFAVAVALVSTAFIELTHGIKRHGARLFPRLPVRMAVGGAAVVLLWLLVGTSDYLGLGVPTIERAFTDPTLPATSFVLKLVFTAITLGVGFVGGEVTPLFFVGAALGNLLSGALDIPLVLGAGVGLAAVFATASNTPIALSIMAAELLGVNVLPHALIACAIAYRISGHRSIYPSQRVHRDKGGKLLSRPTAIAELG